MIILGEKFPDEKTKDGTNGDIFFIDNNKDSLLITVGDSWTWGDSFKDLSADYRSQHVYGTHLSRYLNTDWINYGDCGSSNPHILLGLEKILNLVYKDYCPYIEKELYEQLRGPSWPSYKDYLNFSINEKYLDELITYHLVDRLKITKNAIKKQYKKVYICFTLTETGRYLSKHALENFSSINDMLVYEEKTMYRNLRRLQNFNSNIELVIGRNFSVDFNDTNNSLCIEKNWNQINYEYNASNGFDNHNYTLNEIQFSGAVSGIAISTIKETTVKDRKEYIANQIESVDKLWTWLRNNPMNNNIATCHPTELSHKIWAEYLKQQFKV